MTNQNIRETKEQRLLGVSFILARETQNGLSVLTMQDSPKTEVAAGFYRWLLANNPSWSFPGGGRAVTEDGEPETREEALQSELEEEMGLLLSFSLLQQGEVQKVPFLVGQKKNELIHQIGVTSVLYWFDSLGQPEQKYIDDKNAEGFLNWILLEELYSQFLEKSVSKSASIESRPHLFTTAYLWYLDLVQKYSTEAVTVEMNTLNRKTRAFLVHQSQQLDIPIQNGAFDTLGNALKAEQLNEKDANFLYDTKQVVR